MVMNSWKGNRFSNRRPRRQYVVDIVGVSCGMCGFNISPQFSSIYHVIRQVSLVFVVVAVVNNLLWCDTFLPTTGSVAGNCTFCSFITAGTFYLIVECKVRLWYWVVDTLSISQTRADLEKKTLFSNYFSCLQWTNNFFQKPLKLALKLFVRKFITNIFVHVQNFYTCHHHFWDISKNIWICKNFRFTEFPQYFKLQLQQTKWNAKIGCMQGNYIYTIRVATLQTNDIISGFIRICGM